MNDKAKLMYHLLKCALTYQSQVDNEVGAWQSGRCALFCSLSLTSLHAQRVGNLCVHDVKHQTKCLALVFSLCIHFNQRFCTSVIQFKLI